MSGGRSVDPAVNGIGQGGTETVMLVDDSHAVRTVSRRALERLGYRVLEADSAESALALAADAAEIHLLLTDVTMPGMSGHHLAHSLLSARPGTKVLFMSGYAETDDVSRVFASHIQKPFSLESLAARVREVLDS